VSPASHSVSPRLHATNYSSVYRTRRSAGRVIHLSKVSSSNASSTTHHHVHAGGRTLVFFEPKALAVLQSNRFFASAGWPLLPVAYGSIWPPASCIKAESLRCIWSSIQGISAGYRSSHKTSLLGHQSDSVLRYHSV